jgi:hypothetical protein
VRSAYLAHACEKRPLVDPWDQVLIDEDAVVLPAWALLQRQGDQISESSLRHRVLIGKEAVVRIQADIRSPLHRFGEDMRSELSSQRGRNGFLEEEPDVRASS